MPRGPDRTDGLASVIWRISPVYFARWRFSFALPRAWERVAVVTACWPLCTFRDAMTARPVMPTTKWLLGLRASVLEKLTLGLVGNSYEHTTDADRVFVL